MRVDFILRNFNCYKEFIESLATITNKSQSFIITHFVKLYIQHLKDGIFNSSERIHVLKRTFSGKYIVHLKFNKVFYDYIKRFAFKYDYSVNAFIVNAIRYIFSECDFHCDIVGYSEYYDFLISYFTDKDENISVRNYNFSRFNLRKK